MNPQETQSTYSSLIVTVLGVGMGALVTKGYMTKDQASALAPQLGAAVLGVSTVAVVWWKKRQHSPAALVAAVNSPAVPGVKVVLETSASPAVTITKTGAIKTIPTTG